MDWGSEGRYANMDPDLMQHGFDDLMMEDEEFLDQYYGEDPERGFDYFDDYEYDPYNMHPDSGYNDEDMYLSRIPASELLDQCMLPTLSQAFNTVVPLLGLCFISRITAYCTNERKETDLHVCRTWHYYTSYCFFVGTLILFALIGYKADVLVPIICFLL